MWKYLPHPLNALLSPFILCVFIVGTEAIASAFMRIAHNNFPMPTQKMWSNTTHTSIELLAMDINMSIEHSPRTSGVVILCESMRKKWANFLVRNVQIHALLEINMCFINTFHIRSMLFFNGISLLPFQLKFFPLTILIESLQFGKRFNQGKVMQLAITNNITCHHFYFRAQTLVKEPFKLISIINNVDSRHIQSFYVYFHFLIKTCNIEMTIEKAKSPGQHRDATKSNQLTSNIRFCDLHKDNGYFDITLNNYCYRWKSFIAFGCWLQIEQ